MRWAHGSTSIKSRLNSGNVCYNFLQDLLLSSHLLLKCVKIEIYKIIILHTVFARSNTGVLGSNSTRGMNVCVRLFNVCVVLCVGSGLATDWSLSKESYRLCIGLRNWKSRQGPKSCRAIYIILHVVLYECESWSLQLREDHRQRVLENRLLRRTFALKEEKVTGG
jgi:hypothetical protein